jgi:hypothetical protein
MANGIGKELFLSCSCLVLTRLGGPRYHKRWMVVGHLARLQVGCKSTLRSYASLVWK